MSSLPIPATAHVLSFPSPLHSLMEVKSADDKMHIFKGNSFICVNKCLHVRNYHRNQDGAHFHHSHVSLCLWVIHTSLLPLDMNVRFLEFRVNRIIQCVCFVFLTLQNCLQVPLWCVSTVQLHCWVVEVVVSHGGVHSSWFTPSPAEGLLDFSGFCLL